MTAFAVPGKVPLFLEGREPQHLAGVAPHDAAEHLHERRLAGAVLADQAADLAGAKHEVAVQKRADGAVGLRRVAQLDDGCPGVRHDVPPWR